MILSLVFVLFFAAAIFIAQATLHPPKKNVSRRNMERASELAKQFHRTLIEAEIRKKDATLKGWYFKKSQPAHVMILLHGQADNRAGMLPYAELFLRHGYDVLAPDSRGHGLSSGEFVSYGIKEIEDLSYWIDWLQQKNSVQEIFGLGESMGGAILLQSLRKEPRWKAVIAESSFSDFNRIANERLSQRTKLPSGCLVDSAFAYARLRYGLKFDQVSPSHAVSKVSIPILLIHGMQDKNIGYHHSESIAQANKRIEIWRVPNTGHTAALGTHRSEFEERVLQFLDRSASLL